MDPLHFAIAILSCLTGIDGRSVGETDEGLLCNLDEGNEYNKQDVATGGACILDVNTDLPKENEPLYLQRTPSGSLELVLPEMEGRRGVIALREGQQLVISCPGRNNNLAATKTVFSGASCRAGNKLSIDGSVYSSGELACNSRPASITRPTQKRCARGNGIIVELGFEVENFFIPMVESCHDVENSRTFYVTHTLNGAVLRGKVYRTAARPRFDRGDKIFFKGFNPEVAYTQKNQQDVLARELGADDAKRFFDVKKDFYMARGHLAPDADFLFSSHQFLTYFFVNVAPQWQSINAGNWLVVEKETRRLATDIGADFQVVTGTEGILTLSGSSGQKEIRLQDSRLPVPAHFWKVVRNTQDDSCIGFVSTNNPFLTSKPKTICQDICAENGWPVLQNNLSIGYVYCCRYEDIKRAIPEMPDLSCKSILRGK